jgi:hypothetical protein
MNAYELADKVDFEPYGTYGEQAANMLRQQADRIAELEKQLNFQPNQTLACPSYLSGLTPQIKELSDEEIANLWLEYGYGQPLSNSTFDFARAILKKASEK